MEVITLNNFSEKRPFKRRKLSKACINCRKRRTKCDQQKPHCTRCVEKGIKDCSYPTNEIKVELTDAVPEDDNHSPVQISPIEHVMERKLSPTAFRPEDDVPLDMNRFQRVRHKPNRIQYFGVSAWRSFLYMDSGILFKYISFFDHSLKKDRGKWKSFYKPKALAYDPLVDVEDMRLMKNLQMILPPYDEMLLYLNSFFSSLWFQLLPVVEEKEVMKAFHTIVSRDDKGRAVLNHGCQIINFAHLALILTLMKYVLLFCAPGTKDKIGTFEDHEGILVRFINKLLTRANYMEKCSLPGLQTLFLLRILKKHDPADGDGGDGSKGTMMFSICFKMATSLALHQDVDFLYASQTPAYRKVLKNLWVKILYCDASESFDLGTPLLISDQHLRVDLLDQNDIDVKTTLELRKACNTILAPTVTIRLLLERINCLQSFLQENFEPIFNLIIKLQAASDKNSAYDALRNIFLSYPIISLLQHAYQFMYYITDHKDKERSIYFFCRATKFTLLLLTASTEFMRRLRAPYTNSIKFRELDCIAGGITRQSFTRCFIFYASILIDGLSEARATGMARVNGDVLMKTSSLQKIEDDEDEANLRNQPNRMMIAITTLNHIMTSSISMVLSKSSIVNDPATLINDVSDYSLFIVMTSLHYFNKIIDRDPVLEHMLNIPGIRVEILYDAFGDFIPVDFYNKFSIDAIINSPTWLGHFNQLNEDFFEKFISTGEIPLTTNIPMS